MRKFIVITLSCVIFLLSFAFCFASNEPIILPVGDGTEETGYAVSMSDGSTYYYSANSSPVYLVNYKSTSSGQMIRLLFSDNPGAVVYSYTPNGTQSLNLTNSYNGYYYASSTNAVPDTSYGDFASPQDVIDAVSNTVFSTTFDLTYLIDGSVSWLSSMAQAVKANGLLLFFVLFIFVGVGIGLFKRFTN